MPSQDASVTVFSTAASLLLLRDRSMELAAATAQVAAAFGIKDTQVAGRDWLRQLANRDESTANWRAAAELAAVRPPPTRAPVPLSLALSYTPVLGCWHRPHRTSPQFSGLVCGRQPRKCCKATQHCHTRLHA